jgi:hypothetical protein
LAVKRPPGSQIREQRRPPRDCVHIIDIKADTGLVRDRRDVQRRIGRAAGCGNDGAGICKRRSGHDVARP